MNSLVSVLMVVYNSSEYLEEAIHSVLINEYKNLELIISDDGSHDNSAQIVKSFTDPRIRLFENVSNIGEYNNRNKCLKLTRGEYFIFVDGDDTMYKTGLSNAVKFMDSHGTAAFGIVRPKNEIQNIDHLLLSPRQVFKRHYLARSPLNQSFAGNIFRTKVVRDKFQKFPSNIISGDDFIRLSLALEHDVLLLEKPFAKWRERPGQATERKSNSVKGMLEPFLINNYFMYHRKSPLTNYEKKDARQKALIKIYHQAKQCIKKGKFGRLIHLITILKYFYGKKKGQGLILKYE